MSIATRAIALIMIFGMSGAALAADQAPASAASAPQTAEQVRREAASSICEPGYMDFLPGDFYACEAKRYYQMGKPWRTVELLRDSAYWASKPSQYALGLMYFNGDDRVPVNRPLGIAWLALAAERHNSTYAEGYAAAVARATLPERQQAGVLWQKMKGEYGDAVAARRATRFYDAAMRPFEDAEAGGGVQYVRGFSPLPETTRQVFETLKAKASEDFLDWRGTVMVGALVEVDKLPPTADQATSASH